MGSVSNTEIWIRFIISNTHIMLIMSTVLSFGIDYWNLDSTIELELSNSEKFVLFHSLGVLVWQIIHYCVGCKLVNCIDPSLYAVLVVFEIAQLYVFLLGNWNTIINKQRISGQRVFELFEYTMTSLTYSKYLYIALSVLTCFPLCSNIFEKKEEEEEEEEEYVRSKKLDEIVLGVSYETLKNITTFLSLVAGVSPVCISLLDIFLLANKNKTNTDEDVIFLFLVLFFMIIVFIRSLFQSTPDDLTFDMSWTYFEIVEIFLILSYIFNPLSLKLLETTASFREQFYTLKAYYYLIPVYLIGKVLRGYVNYKMCSSIKFKNMPDDETWNEMEWRNITYKSWANILLLLQIVSFTVIPITLWIEKQITISESILEFVEISPTKEQWPIFVNLFLLIWYQISNTAVFCCFVFSSYEDVVVFCEEIVSLILFLCYSFNIFFTPFENVRAYLADDYPYTSMALTLSIACFICAKVLIIVLMCEMEIPEETEEYKVIDGTEESSTKEGHYEHPLYWLSKRKMKESSSMENEKE